MGKDKKDKKRKLEAAGAGTADPGKHKKVKTSKHHNEDTGTLAPAQPAAAVASIATLTAQIEAKEAGLDAANAVKDRKLAGRLLVELEGLENALNFASMPGEASSSDDDSNLYGEPISFADGVAAQAPVNTETRRRPKKEDSDNNNEVNSTAVGDAPVTVQRKRVGVANAPAEATSSDDESNLYGEPISFADGSFAQAPVRAETRRMPKMEDSDNDDGVYAIAVEDGVPRLPAPRKTTDWGPAPIGVRPRLATDWGPAPAQVKRYGETRRRRASDLTMELDHDHEHNYEYTRTGVKDPNPPMYAQPPGNSTSPYVMLDMDHLVYRSPRIHQQTKRDVRFDEAGSYNTAGSDATVYNLDYEASVAFQPNLDYEASVEFQPLTRNRVSMSSMSSKASSQSVHTDYEHYDSFRRSTVDAPSYAQVPGFDDDRSPSDTLIPPPIAARAGRA